MFAHMLFFRRRHHKLSITTLMCVCWRLATPPYRNRAVAIANRYLSIEALPVKPARNVPKYAEWEPQKSRLFNISRTKTQVMQCVQIGNSNHGCIYAQKWYSTSIKKGA